MHQRISPEVLTSPGGGMRVVFTAKLVPVAGMDRFQPAGFPEIGHVIYEAPRGDDRLVPVCIVDSAASMANHLESVCVRSPFDPTPVEELTRLPYLRCVTSSDRRNGNKGNSSHEVVVTSLTEGNRIASTYFLDGKRISGNEVATETFEKELLKEWGIRTQGDKAYPSSDTWWATFRGLFRYDLNSLVHGVLFPKWQIKVPRMLTAHHEAIGASRVDRLGVKFDRIGKTSSGQPIFAVDDETATEIRATFVLDLALLRSYGRGSLGLGGAEKQALAALAMWKVGRLLYKPFRYRSGCDLQCDELAAHVDGQEVKVGPDDLAGIDVDRFLRAAVDEVASRDGVTPGVVDLFWNEKDLFREASRADRSASALADNDENPADEE